MNRRIQSLLFCLAAVLVSGQRAAADSPFGVDAWSTADGLPQGSVLALTQTRDGYLWLGTLNGLVRFDGNSMTPFNVNNTPGLPGNEIIFLFEDSRTDLWVGTASGGLCVIQNGKVNNLQTVGDKILYAYEDETGAVWFCVADGRIICWNKGKLDLQPSFSEVFWEQLFRRAFYLVVPHKNGLFWHLETSRNRVEKWSGDNLQADFGPFQWTPAIAVFSSAAAKSSLLFDSAVTAACVDRDGNLVVGTRGEGVFWMDGQGGWRHITMGEKSSENFVPSVCFDREGNLWGGTDGGGLYRVRKNFFETPARLSTGVAKSVAEDSAGGLWVAYNTRGLTYALTNSAADFHIGAKGNAWSVFVDHRQQVWAGTRDEGLFHFNARVFQPVVAANPIGPQIFALFESHDGKLWVGGQNGLGRFDGQDWKIFSTADGLPHQAVRALAEDVDSNLWIGTDGGGIYMLRDGRISPVNAPVKDVSCLLSGRDGVLWAGTFGHGLARLAQGHWTSYSAADGLVGDDIGFLIEDDSGSLWLGSYEGLTRVSKKSLADFAAGAAYKVSCRTFLTRECSVGAQPAAIRARDGRLYFPTIQGLISLNPEELQPNTNLPPVVIESVLVDGVKRNENSLSPAANSKITLTPENEQLEIHFTALSFSAPKGAQFGVRFKYQFAGRDKSWTDVGGERVAHFSRLAPGQYMFHVVAFNEDGVPNLNGATLAVIVQPAFWQTLSFKIITALCLLGGIGGLIYFFATQKLQRELAVMKQHEALEKERARIARDLHDQLGANLTQVTLLGELAEADKDLPEEVESHAQQICQTARETTHALDEIVWAINPSNDTLEGLVNYACKYAQEYLELAGVSHRFEVPAQLPAADIAPDVRHNVFLAFKESVNNVVKHAQASSVWIRLRLEPRAFTIEIEDNGRGLANPEGKPGRNGLRNMRKRMEDVGGSFTIGPAAAQGTVVRLSAPMATN